jgi:hypothetical protein
MYESNEEAYLVLYRLKEFTTDPPSYTACKEFKLNSSFPSIEFKLDKKLISDRPKPLT